MSLLDDTRRFIGGLPGGMPTPVAPAAPAASALAKPKPFDVAFDFIMDPQRDGHENDSAPGETFGTRWGVTEMSWRQAVDDGVVQGDFGTCTRDQCKAVYRANYWNKMRCDAFPAGVSLVLFNDATLTGNGHVARLLQRVVGTTEDGAIGAQTIGAAAAWKPADLIRALIAADETYLASLANAPRFLNGWNRREDECKAAAIALET